ncbi:hypothetical protein PoB_000039600 [Plakobranchus ocellatus]|uniref:Uncharacterized protein n=1 Tax=Plakobranchus ocellatus TaxID=259542 RepID=A0AAV3XS95_9GAST|nr:hypothetical protein PoB_000039600 [Plakobranchus ocellatus]
MPDSVKAVTGIAKRLLLIFYKVALGESCVAHPKPTHCRLPFSVCSFTSFAEVFSQVGEYFVELVCSLSIPTFLPNGVDVCSYSRFKIGPTNELEDDALFRAAFASCSHSHSPRCLREQVSRQKRCEHRVDIS